jgi:hypothetical protein
MHVVRWFGGAAALCAALFIARCGGSKDCASSADCDTGQQCVFGENAGCTAKGACASIVDNCDSTFATQVCGCHGDKVKQARCLDAPGFLGPVNPSQHCFDPDASTLFPPDGSDDVGSIEQDAARHDATAADGGDAD